MPFCDSYRIQTCNLLIRSQMLYSVELRSRRLSAFLRCKVTAKFCTHQIFNLFLEYLLSSGVIYAENGACESQGFAESYQYRRVNLARGVYHKAGNEQSGADHNEEHGADKLDTML